MKRTLLFLTLVGCLSLFAPSVTKIVAPEEDSYNQKEIMADIAKRTAEIKKANDDLMRSIKKKAKSKITLQQIEKYQQAMDYQQINLDKLRKTLPIK